MNELLAEQNAASATGPRALKDAGSAEWCWQTVSSLQSMWQSLNLDYHLYMNRWQQAEEHAIWEKIPQRNPFGTKEAMLAALEDEGRPIGDDAAARARLAVQAIAVRPLNKGNDSNYRVVRLARDHPEIWERMKNGEFKSVAEAERAAGIYKPRPKTVSLSTDISRVAGNIKKHYSPEQVEALRDALSEQNGTNAT